MAFNRAEKARTNRLSHACVAVQTAFRRHMFERDYKVNEEQGKLGLRGWALKNKRSAFVCRTFFSQFWLEATLDCSQHCLLINFLCKTRVVSSLFFFHCGTPFEDAFPSHGEIVSTALDAVPARPDKTFSGSLFSQCGMKGKADGYKEMCS